MNDLLKSFLTFLTAWLLIVGSLWMIDRIITSLENPDLATLPESTLGMIVGALVLVLSRAGEFVFQSEAGRTVARSISAAATSASQTALQDPTKPIPASQPVVDQEKP